MALSAIATVLGAAVQSASGFGFALLAAPAFLAALDRREAVASVLILSLALNLLMLAGERRRPEVLVRPLLVLLAAAVPGIAGGALLLRAMSKPALQVLAGALILIAAALAARRRAAARQRVGAAGTAAVGLAAGALTATTTVNGPPIVLWLQRRGASAGETRDSLAAAFAVLNLLGSVAVSVLAGAAGRGADPVTILALAPALVVGQLAGRWAFVRLDPARFRAVAIALVLVAGAASIAAGIAAAG